MAEEAKRKEKERKKAELAAKEAEKEAKRRIPPTEMFKSMSSKDSPSFLIQCLFEIVLLRLFLLFNLWILLKLEF